MKRLVIGMACAILMACGGNPNSPSKQGSIVYRLDANSCGPILGTSTLALQYFVDGTQVGSATVGVGQTSPPFAISPTSHVASASVANFNYQWPSLNFTVASGQTFTYVLICT